jgi:hypothetical protein
MAVQIGPKIGIEGEKEYRTQIQQIIQQTKSLDSAMAATSSAWDANTSQMTKNKATAQNLAAKIQQTAQQLSIMNNMLDQSAAKFGENDVKTLKWKQAVDNTTASLNKMKSQLQSLNGAENFSEVATSMADYGTKMQNLGNSMRSIGVTMSAMVTAPLVAAGAASVKLASDLEEASSKADVVFGSMSGSVQQFAADALNSFGLAAGTALDMASTFGAMASSMGMSDEVASEMSTTLTGLAADMASFYNVSVDVANTALQSVFTGETEALKKFGIVMTQTNLEEFARQQGEVYSAMSESEKVMTRYNFVLEQTKDAQGDFERTSDGTANSLRVFQESLKALGEAFGEVLLPVVTPIIQAITRVVQTISQLPAPIRTAIAAILAIVAAIGPFLLISGTLIGSLGNLIAVAPAVATAFQAAVPAVLELAASFTALTASAGPWVILAVAIAAAAIAIVANWDQISAGAVSMADACVSAFQRAAAGIKALWTDFNDFQGNMKRAFDDLPGAIASALASAIQAVKDSFRNMINTAKQSGKDMINGFVQGMMEPIQKIIDQCKAIGETIKSYLGFSRPDKGPLHEYETWMPDFMQGLAKGINQNKKVVTRAIEGVAKTMALPLDASATMNMALAGAGADGASYIGGTSMNIYVDHISELQDLIRIQNQAQQRYRMGAK